MTRGEIIVETGNWKVEAGIRSGGSGGKIRNFLLGTPLTGDFSDFASTASTSSTSLRLILFFAFVIDNTHSALVGALANLDNKDVIESQSLFEL